MELSKFSIFTLVVLFSLQLTASYASEFPKKCPSASVIKQFPFLVANGHSGDWWIVSAAEQKYDTKEKNWSFVFYVNKAKDETDAIKQATDAVKTLTLTDGPRYYDSYAECNYSVMNPKIGDAAARCFYEICY